MFGKIFPDQEQNLVNLVSVFFSNILILFVLSAYLGMP